MVCKEQGDYLLKTFMSKIPIWELVLTSVGVYLIYTTTAVPVSSYGCFVLISVALFYCGYTGRFFKSHFY